MKITSSIPSQTGSVGESWIVFVVDVLFAARFANSSTIIPRRLRAAWAMRRLRFQPISNLSAILFGCVKKRGTAVNRCFSLTQEQRIHLLTLVAKLCYAVF